MVQKITDDMPKYHSHAMKQKFDSLFGRMVKPAYLCEMYQEITGDCSVASSKTESHINDHVR